MQQQAAMYSAMNVNQLQQNPYIAAPMQMNPYLLAPTNYQSPLMVTTMMAMQQNVQKQQLQPTAQSAQFVRANNMCMQRIQHSNSWCLRALLANPS